MRALPLSQALPELRLVLAVSLDGRLAPAGGGPAQLGGTGDRRVLEEALAWADGCLIGAETLRLHGSTCIIHGADLLADRDGRLWAIEVNAVPGWRALAAALQIDVARLVLDHVGEIVRERRR